MLLSILQTLVYSKGYHTEFVCPELPKYLTPHCFTYPIFTDHTVTPSRFGLQPYKSAHNIGSYSHWYQPYLLNLTLKLWKICEDVHSWGNKGIITYSAISKKDRNKSREVNTKSDNLCKWALLYYIESLGNIQSNHLTPITMLNGPSQTLRKVR